MRSHNIPIDRICGSSCAKKKNPETSVPGLKKSRSEIQTYFVTFGVRPENFDSKGL
jgi:hypothetical protein